MSREIRIILTPDGYPRPISDFDTRETIEILQETTDKLTKFLQENMLKPCPFCGAEISVDDVRDIKTEYSDDDFLSQVVCPECSASGPIGFEKSRSAEHWNTRK